MKVLKGVVTYRVDDGDGLMIFMLGVSLFAVN